MNHSVSARRSPVVRLLTTAAVGAVLYKSWPFVQAMPNGPDLRHLAWGVGAMMALAGGYGFAGDVTSVLTNAARTFRAHRPKLSDASAKWLTAHQAGEAGLGTTAGLFLGTMDGQPIFIPNGVHGLLCAPARSGKSTGFVMDNLGHDIGASRVVADMKGELLYQTGDLIRDQHGHEVIALNPAHKFSLGNVPYNPVQIILDDLENAPQDAIADAWSMVFQLYPRAPGGERDPYWPNGTRKLLVFVVVALAALRGEREASLPRAYQVLSDNDELQALLLEALSSEVLGGELRALAANISATWQENLKHFESFREGAVQRLVPFGPSGRLAPSMESCGFRFRDLKRRKITLFLICDYSRMDVFGPWIGLLIWAALKELVREDNDVPVHFILDEFTNYRLSDLPNALTALGGYGLHFWMIVQELEEIARVYGREALATILSQSDVKQFFGVTSPDTAKLITRLLGNQEVTGESFGLGSEAFASPNTTRSQRAKPLLTEDQIRRLPTDEQIIFIRNLPPIRALKVGYHEIDPWREQVRPNPLYGGKPFLGKIKLRIRNGRAKATGAGRRKIKREKRPLIGPLLAAASHLLPGAPAILLIVGIISVLTFGWPYLLIEYDRSGSWCQYYGPPFITQPVEHYGEGYCPIIIWKK